MRNLEISSQKIPVANQVEKAKMAIIEAPGKIVFKEMDLPHPGEGEVRVKLQGCGICSSNLPVWQGREWFNYPIAPGNPGHEAWGIVDAIGEGVKGIAQRMRVTGISYNAFGSHDIFKQENIVVLPDFLDSKPFPGEPMGCVMNIFRRSKIETGNTVAVVGCGFIGLLLIQLLKTENCKVIAISRREFSRNMAAKFGADHVLPMDDHYKIIEAVSEITNENFCDAVFECTGMEWPLNLGIELTKTRGKLIVAGYHQDGMRKINMQLLNWRGIDMINAHEREASKYIKGIQEAIEAIRTGRLNPFELFNPIYRLSELESALNDLQNRPTGYIKGIVINEDIA